MHKLIPATAALLLAAGAAAQSQAQGFTEVDRVTLQELDPATNDGHFGVSLALTEGFAWVGAPDKSGGGAVFQFAVLPGGQLDYQQQVQAGEATSGFGVLVAADGDWLAITDRASDVRLYRRAGPDWTLAQTIRLEDVPEPAGTDLRGLRTGLALQGDTLVLGDDSANLQTGAGQVSNAGALVLYRLQGAQWAFEQVIRNPEPAGTARFGTALAVSGDTLLAGARLAGDGDGRAYVFARGSTGWALQRTLFVPDGTQDGAFGWSVALDGDVAAVGCRICNATDDGPSNAGSLFVFERDRGGAGTWGPRGEYAGSEPGYIDEFSNAMRLRGDLLLVGATGAGNKLVYFFGRAPDGSWSEVAKLHNGEGQNTQFGVALDFLGGKVLVGADRWPDQPPAPNRYGAVYSYRSALLDQCRGGLQAVFCDSFEALQ